MKQSEQPLRLNLCSMEGRKQRRVVYASIRSLIENSVEITPGPADYADKKMIKTSMPRYAFGMRPKDDTRMLNFLCCVLNS